MRTLKHWITLPAALALSGAGCVGSAGHVGESRQAIALSSLPPDLPGCQAVATNNSIIVRHVDGADDLYVAYSGGRPICIDSSEDIKHQFTGGIASDPGDSNPMPGEPLAPAGSNPMPGNPDPSSVGTVASNPMPGTDPGQSNPMPGQPTYPGQQGYTTGH